MSRSSAMLASVERQMGSRLRSWLLRRADLVYSVNFNEQEQELSLLWATQRASASLELKESHVYALDSAGLHLTQSSRTSGSFQLSIQLPAFVSRICSRLLFVTLERSEQ